MKQIGLSKPDHPAISSSAMTAAQAPGLQNSRDIAPIVVALQANNTLPLHSATEHNPPGAGEKVASTVENLVSCLAAKERNGRK